LASNAKMKAWALELTREGKTDLEKARRLFEALARRPDGRKEGGTRTAEQVYSLWQKKDESFTCQEYAKLFVALARDAGLDAFYVHLEKDYEGRVVYHDCAAVFVDGQALLVDPAYRWFGPPHQSFLLLDDVQVIAHQLFQPGGTNQALLRCRAAGKLHPGFAWGQLQLVRQLRAAERMSEARRALALANEMEPDRWDALQIQGEMDFADGDMSAAVADLRKSIKLNPANPESHFALGAALANQGQLKEAREEFRATLRHAPPPALSDAALKSLARVNEELGEE
jgi:cytochrome c-type biogenesis protein CcmH/NrfG